MDIHNAGFATVDPQKQPYVIQVSQSEFKLIGKVSKDLVPQLIKLQQDTQAHERYLDPEVSDVAAVYMQQSDTLLAASDEVRRLMNTLTLPYYMCSNTLLNSSALLRVSLRLSSGSMVSGREP